MSWTCENCGACGSCPDCGPSEDSPLHRKSAETGAPSCDSELEEIRVRVGIGMSFGEVYDDRRTLLRMVDELRAQLASTDPEFDATDAAHPAWWRGHDHTAKKFEELVSELRTKLAESARIHAESEAKHAYRAKELEAKLTVAQMKALGAETREAGLQAKLTEAESLRELDLIALSRTRERAETAEAQAANLTVANGGLSESYVADSKRIRILEAENATLHSCDHCPRQAKYRTCSECGVMMGDNKR